MGEDPNQQVTEQIRKMEIAKAIEDMKKQEEIKKQQSIEQEKIMESKILEILKKQQPSEPSKNNPPKESDSTPKSKVVERNPWEQTVSKKVTTKKTLLNPYDGVYTSVDPQSIGNVDFEYDNGFDEEKQKLFKEQYTKAGQEGKAMTIPEGVKAFRIEQQEEDME